MNEISLKQSGFTTASDQRPKTSMGWLIALTIVTSFAVLALVAGLGLSIMLGAHVVEQTARLTYLTVGLLAVSFILMFAAGHCMDRITSIASDRRAERVLEDCSQRQTTR